MTMTNTEIISFFHYEDGRPVTMKDFLMGTEDERSQMRFVAYMKLVSIDCHALMAKVRTK